MKVVIIAGSQRDVVHVHAIAGPLGSVVHPDIHYCSAHKEPRRLLDILQRYNNEKTVFVTVAGRSNALSGVVAANSESVVIACPPSESTADYLADIHSSLRMPSGVPVLTILGAENCAQAVLRIVKDWFEPNHDQVVS